MTQVFFTGDGSTREYDVTFPFLSEDDVKLSVDGVDQTITWISGSRIQLATAPASGAEVRLYRDTQIDEALVSFQDGAVLSAADLNLADTQLLYKQQELEDRAAAVNVALNRALRMPVGEALTALPSAAERSNKLLSFDQNGDPVMLAAADGAAALALADGSEFVGFLHKGVGPLLTTVAQRLMAEVPFEIFLPDDYDYETDDASEAMEKAAAWSAQWHSTVTFSKHYRLEDNVTIADEGVRFHFVDAQFDILDTNMTAITSGAIGPIGLLIQGAYVRVTGSADLIGLGTETTTQLAGIIVDTADHVVIGDFYYENMAAGLWTMHAAHGKFGDVRALKMHGLQTFGGVFTAGSAVVTAGTRHSVFGKIDSRLNYKPILYLSVATDSEGAAVDNAFNYFGFVSGSSAPGSTESSVISPRSSFQNTFEGADATGFSKGLNFQRYDTDAGFSVDQNWMGDWYVEIAKTAASADTGLQSVCDPGFDVGRNYVRSFHAKALAPMAGTGYGASIETGDIIVGQFTTEGFDRGVKIIDGSLTIEETARFVDPGFEAILYGQGANLKVKRVELPTGTVVSGRSALIRHDNAIGSGITSVSIEEVVYEALSGNDVLFIAFDPVHSPMEVRYGHVSGVGTTGAVRWLTDAFTVRNGILYKASAPAVGMWEEGDFVRAEPPTADGTIEWSRATTGGTNVLGVDWIPFTAYQSQPTVADATAGTEVATINAVIAALEAAGVFVA